MNPHKEVQQKAVCMYKEREGKKMNLPGAELESAWRYQ